MGLKEVDMTAVMVFFLAIVCIVLGFITAIR